ncbi:MAG: sulfotransferase [Myxococcota bacterium]
MCQDIPTSSAVASPSECLAAPLPVGQQTSRPPVIVVGALRSGTTLFNLMLGHHRDVVHVGEYEEAVELLDNRGFPEVSELHAHLATSRQFEAAQLEIDPDLDYPELVRDLLEQRVANHPEAVTGITIHSRFDRCPDLWPDARFIHVIRDPRDVARSCIGMGWVGNVYRGAEIWLEAEKRWERLKAEIRDDQWMEVRYEALVRNPETVLSEVCEFLGLEYDPEMLEFWRDSTYDPPDPSLVEQWRRRLTPREIQNVEYRCGDMLTARDYLPSEHGPRTPTVAERVALDLDNRYKRAQAALKRYGLGLWLADRLTKRVVPASVRTGIELRKNDADRSYVR